MIALESLQHTDFSGQIGGVFTVVAGSGIDLHLTDVKLIGHRHPDATRDPFSLTFSGPKGLRIPQGTYRVECATPGAMEIFITQVGDNQRGSEFEAIFT